MRLFFFLLVCVYIQIINSYCWNIMVALTVLHRSTGLRWPIRRAHHFRVFCSNQLIVNKQTEKEYILKLAEDLCMQHTVVITHVYDRALKNYQKKKFRTIFDFVTLIKIPEVELLRMNGVYRVFYLPCVRCFGV